MASGAWQFLSFPWHHPILSCIVLIFFSPPFFPVLVYFSPLLISTALVAISLVSMNVQGSVRSSEDDSQFQTEPAHSPEPVVHMEIVQSKPAQESWLEWMRNLEDKAKAWVEDDSGLRHQENWGKAGKINLNVIQRYVPTPLLDAVSVNKYTEALQRQISAPLLGVINGSRYFTDEDLEDVERSTVNNVMVEGHPASVRTRELLNVPAPTNESEILAVVNVGDYHPQPVAVGEVLEASNERSTSSAPEAEDMQRVTDVRSLHLPLLGLLEPLNLASYDGVVAVAAEEVETMSTNQTREGLLHLLTVVKEEEVLPVPQDDSLVTLVQEAEEEGQQPLASNESDAGIASVVNHRSAESVGKAPLVSDEGVFLVTLDESEDNSLVEQTDEESQPIASGETNVAETDVREKALPVLVCVHDGLGKVPGVDEQVLLVAADESVDERPIEVSVKENQAFLVEENFVDMVASAGLEKALPVLADENVRQAQVCDEHIQVFTMDEGVAETRMMKPESGVFVNNSDEGASSEPFLMAHGTLVSGPEEGTLGLVSMEADQIVLSDETSKIPSESPPHCSDSMAEEGLGAFEVNASDKDRQTSMSEAGKPYRIASLEMSFDTTEKDIFVDESSKTPSTMFSSRSIDPRDLFEIVAVQKSGSIVSDQIVYAERELFEISLGRRSDEGALDDESIEAWKPVSLTDELQQESEGPTTLVSRSFPAENLPSRTGEVQLAPQNVQECQSFSEEESASLGSPITEDTTSTHAPSVQSSKAIVKAVEYDNFMDRYFALKKTMSFSTRKQTEYENSFTLGRAEAAEKDETARAAEPVHSSAGMITRVETDPFSESLVFPEKKHSPKLNTRAQEESVEAITARLQKKFTPNWIKEDDAFVRRKEETSSQATMTPERVLVPAPALSSSAVEREKNEEGIDGFMSPMKKVISAFRNAGKKDGGVNNVFPLTPEKGVFSAVLNRRDKFMSQRMKSFSSIEGNAGKLDSAGIGTELLSTKKLVSPNDIVVLGDKEEGSSDRLLKDRLISPLKRVFSMDANRGKKVDPVNGWVGSSPAKGGSSSVKLTSVKEQSSSDKLKDKFLRIFSTEGSGERNSDVETEKSLMPGLKCDSNEANAKVGEDAGKLPPVQESGVSPFCLALLPEKHGLGQIVLESRIPPERASSEVDLHEKNGEKEVGDGGMAPQPSKSSLAAAAIVTQERDEPPAVSRFKSPEKKFSLSWRKKRAKDDISTSGKTNDELSDKFTLPIISFSSFSEMNMRYEDDVSSDGYHSPERSFFRPSFRNRESRKANLSEDRIESPDNKKVPISSWWSRRKGLEEDRNPIASGESASSPKVETESRSFDDHTDENCTPPEQNVSSYSWLKRGRKGDLPSNNRLYTDEDGAHSPSPLHIGEQKLSPSETVHTLDDESPVSGRLNYFAKSITMPREDRTRRRNEDGMDPVPSLHKSRSSLGTTADHHAHERFSNSSNRSNLDAGHTQERILRNSFGRSDLQVNKLYRNTESSPSKSERLINSSLNRTDAGGRNRLYRQWESPSNAEISITDKLKAPLEEVLSLLAAGENQSTTSAIAEESSSSEETCSSEGEWSSSEDEDEAEEHFSPMHRGKEEAASPFFQHGKKLPTATARRFQ